MTKKLPCVSPIGCRTSVPQSTVFKITRLPPSMGGVAGAVRVRRATRHLDDGGSHQTLAAFRDYTLAELRSQSSPYSVLSRTCTFDRAPHFARVSLLRWSAGLGRTNPRMCRRTPPSPPPNMPTPSETSPSTCLHPRRPPPPRQHTHILDDRIT